MANNENAAVAALITRFVRTWDQREADQKLQVELTKRLVEANQTMTSLHTAFSLFGIDTREDGVWPKVSARIGQKLFDDAIAEGKRPPPPPPPPFPLPPPANEAGDKSGEADEAAAAPEKDGALVSTLDVSPSVRETVLGHLKLVGRSGAKAHAIREAYEQQFGAKLHEKTIGMTLYRLSKEIPPLARREGRTWFFVQPEGETKNPGGETPGHIDDLL
jgi:hypothetical protein